jgi:predicted ATPase
MKLQIFAAHRLMVRNKSRQRPCIVVIEDLHWIDPTSKEYVEMLVDRLPGAAILLRYDVSSWLLTDVDGEILCHADSPPATWS